MNSDSKNTQLNKQNEFDITICPVKIHLNQKSCIIVFGILNSFMQVSVARKINAMNNESKKTRSPIEELFRVDPGLGALLWLEEQQRKKKTIKTSNEVSYSNDDDIENDEVIGNGVNLNELISLLKQVNSLFYKLITFR